MEEISNHEQLRATKKSTVEGLRKALLIVRNPDAQGAGESCFSVVFWVGFVSVGVIWLGCQSAQLAEDLQYFRSDLF